jgi:hypothetical protein
MALSKAESRPLEIVAEFDRRADALATSKKTTSTRADVNGHYRFQDIRPGRYYLYASHQVFENRPRWWVAVELKPGDQVVDLSNSNAGWAFSLKP